MTDKPKTYARLGSLASTPLTSANKPAGGTGRTRNVSHISDLSCISGVSDVSDVSTRQIHGGIEDLLRHRAMERALADELGYTYVDYGTRADPYGFRWRSMTFRDRILWCLNWLRKSWSAKDLERALVGDHRDIKRCLTKMEHQGLVFMPLSGRYCITRRGIAIAVKELQARD
jgi:hypothetical protein